MLTRAELLVAADCAERYPRGWGISFFHGTYLADYGEAVKAVQQNPSLLESG